MPGASLHLLALHSDGPPLTMQFMIARGIFIALSICFIGWAIPAAAQTLVDEGRPVARIYLAPGNNSEPADPNSVPPLETAVEELNYHLRKMSGAQLEVVLTSDAEQVRGPAIVLGALARKLGAIPTKKSESGEAFRLLTRGDQLLIGGESEGAVLLGVYALLEKMGCEWVMPGVIGEIIPQRDTVSLPEMDETQVPDFAMRKLWYRGGRKLVSTAENQRFRQWMRRQRGGTFEPVAKQTEGHHWQEFIRKHQAQFDEDPTMYALRRDASGELKRLGPQIESTHPLVIELMAQDIREVFAKKGWAKDRNVGFPIGPADGVGFSESPEALAVGSGTVDAVSGVMDQTEQMVLLANRIIAELGEEYPNVYLGYYSYGAHAGYPQRYKPHPRLVQIFAPINFSRYHSVVDDTSRSQGRYREVVEQWADLSAEQGNPLLFRGYNWNLAENILPYTKVRIWGEELPFYKRMGFIGLNVEATKAWGINGPSDWMFAKLAWDSSRDWKDLLHEYCVKSFGAGAPAMEAYFLRLAERQHAAGQEAGSYHAIPLIFDRQFVVAAKRDMDEAMRKARTADQKTRIAHFRPAIEILDRFLDYHEATTRFDFPAAKVAFEGMGDVWQQAYDQNSDIAAKEGPQYLDRFIRPFVDAAAEYTVAPYGILAPLPDQLQTAFASRADGLRLHYDRSHTDETAFSPTSTFSTTWDEQRLTSPDGSVWYRHSFPLPDNMNGDQLALFLGSFDDKATVWLNGQLVGSSGRQFSKPAIFDLTDHMVPGSDNLLAIHIERLDGINEIGIGGLFRPSFLFTFPKDREATLPFAQD